MTLDEYTHYTLIEYGDFKLTLGALTAIVVLYLIIKVFLILFKGFLRRYFKRKKYEASRVNGIYQIVRYFVSIGFILAVIKFLGIDITWLIASSAALMVGIGLGLQNVFNDFISGVILLFEGTVDPKDIVSIGDMVGKVKKIGVRTSHIITQNNITILVPNHKLTDDNVINWSHMNEPPRFKVSVGVAYGSDTKLVKDILLDTANNHPEISKKYEPFVRFTNFGDSSLDFELFFWSDQVFLIEDVMSDLRFQIDEAFRENNVTIPFPQRDLHLKTDVVIGSQRGQ